MEGRRLRLVLLTLGALAFVVIAAYQVYRADTLYDEGGYLYEGWLTCSQGWMPFEDFSTKLPPLLYYWYGVPQALLGPSMLLGRIQSVIALGFAVVVAASIARISAGGWAPVLLMWLTAAGNRALKVHVQAVDYSACSLLIMLMVWGLLTRRRSGRYVSGAAAGLLLLARHDMIFVVACAIVYNVIAGRDVKQKAVPPVLCCLFFAAGVAPFILRTPDTTLQTLTLGMIGTESAPADAAAPYISSEPWTFATIKSRVNMMGRFYFSAFACVLIGGLVHLYTRFRRQSGSDFGVIGPRWALLAAIVIANPLMHAVFGYARGSPAFYLSDYYIWLPLLCLAVVSAARTCSFDLLPGRLRCACPIVVALLVPLQVLLTWDSLRPPTQPSTLARIARGGRVIRQHTEKSDIIFTLDQPHQQLAAGRIVFPPLTHELFAYRETEKTELLNPMFVFNREIMRRWLHSQAECVVMSAGTRKYLSENRRYDQGHELLAIIDAALDEHYVLVAQARGTHKGPLRLYRRRGRWDANGAAQSP